jgi:undecaprenyl-diphosphatase
VDTLKVGAIVLDPWVFRAAAAVLVVLLIRRGAYRLAWWAAVTTIAGGLTGVALKALVERARPVFPDPVHTSPSWSFPSGHALNSAMVTAVILAVVLPALPNRRWRIAAWTAGGLIVLATGYDRIGLGVHYFSDVLAAWFTAAAVVVATAIAFEAWQRAEGAEVGQLSSGLDPDDAEKLR